jgi:hypothetical protein
MNKKDIKKKQILGNTKSIDNAAKYLRDLQSTMVEAKDGTVLAEIRTHMDEVLTRIERSNENIELLISS